MIRLTKDLVADKSNQIILFSQHGKLLDLVGNVLDMCEIKYVSYR